MNRRDFLALGFSLGGGLVAARSGLAGRPQAPAPSASPRPGGDLAIVNSRILTLEAAHLEAEAVLVRDGRIALVGDTRDVRAAAGPARVFDAGGRVVVPGFIDGHVHFVMACNARQYQVACHTPPHTSLQSIFGALREKARQTAAGEWVIGRAGFNLASQVPEGRLATRAELDAISRDHPIVLFSGFHVAMLNTRALKELGLWEHPGRTPRGATVHRDASGAPTGVATEIWDMLPPYSAEQVRAAVKAHARDLFVAKGITSVHELPYSANDIRALQELDAAGELPLRVRFYYHVPHMISLDGLVSTGLLPGFGHDRLRYGGVKIFVDGIGNDGMGRPLEDYKWTPEELTDFVSRAHAAGIQLMMHALTLGAVRMAAGAVEAAQKRHGHPGRHRIEHAGDLQQLEDIRWLGRLGVRPVLTAATRRRPTGSGGRPRTRPPYRTLLREGLEPICVSDATGTVPEFSPLAGIASLMLTEEQGGAAAAGETLTFDEALRTYTILAARAGFEEGEKGSIASGKLGDFAVLSDDPRRLEGEELYSVRVDATIQGGELVFGG